MSYDEEVKIPSWLPLAQLSGSPVSQIGEWGKLLSRLHQNSVPLPPLYVIPTQTFQLIADANHLPDKLTPIVLRQRQNPEQLRQQVISLFKKLEIPHAIARDLINAHQSLIGKQLAKIDSSPAQEIGRGMSLELVQGDANTIESILELWAHSYLRSKQLTSSAFIVQLQVQPSYSGYIVTKDTQGGSAKQMPIWVTTGATPLPGQPHPYAKYLVDTRTWNVTFRQPAEQDFQLLRSSDQLKKVKLSKSEPVQLSDQTLEKIAQLAHQVKLLYLPHSCITWEVTNHQVVITGLTPLGEERLPPMTATSGQVLLQGNVIMPGFVKGTVWVGQPSVPPPQLPPDCILVVPEVTTQLKPYLRHAVGLICEKSLPLFAQQLIQQSLLPTLAPARDASKYVQTGQAILLDAGKGVVYRSPNPTPVAIKTSPLTRTKVLLSVTNPAKIKGTNLNDIDGTYFNSDFTFYQQGVHPQHLVRSDQSDHFSQVLVDRIRLFKSKAQTQLLYQPLSLTTADLIQLQYAHSYEQPEKNPYLGFRGSIKHLHSFDILNLELNALAEAQQMMGNNFGLVIPFTRTVGELRLMLNHVRSFFAQQPAKFELWWQVAVPSNIWQIQQSLTPQLTGIVISIPDLHALMHGIDPANPDLMLKYPIDVPLMRSLITQAFSACPHHKIMLQLDQGDEDLVQLAVELGLAGVIVKPYHAERTKIIISEMEADVLSDI